MGKFTLQVGEFWPKEGPTLQVLGAAACARRTHNTLPQHLVPMVSAGVPQRKLTKLRSRPVMTGPSVFLVLVRQSSLVALITLWRLTNGKAISLQCSPCKQSSNGIIDDAIVCVWNLCTGCQHVVALF